MAKPAKRAALAKTKSKAKAKTEKPTGVAVRAYQVGFGDCFLLSFSYASGDRHVLIDFGSMALPEGAAKGHMLQVANAIKRDCGGDLAVIVATHRHADHISGFATNAKGTAPGNVIASCQPKLVVQPWTENPKAPVDAVEAKAAAAFAATLDNMHTVARAARDTARALRRAASPKVLDELAYLGRDNIKNKSAVENLMTMAQNRYVKSGSRLPTAKLLPGVTVHVLGPPSLKQSDAIRVQRREEADEFWHLQALSGTQHGANGASLFPDLVTRTPVCARWFRDRLRALRADAMLSIVRILDKQMNNTSLILLFEVNGKLLLFPGDAQIENWQYALAQEKWQRKLRDVSMYKVGHHGSLNATPKSLWKQFGRKGAANQKGRLQSLLSTLEGVHGHEESGTEVPRSKLVKALRRETDLTSTQSYEPTELRRTFVL